MLNFVVSFTSLLVIEKEVSVAANNSADQRSHSLLMSDRAIAVNDPVGKS